MTTITPVRPDREALDPDVPAARSAAAEHAPERRHRRAEPAGRHLRSVPQRRRSATVPALVGVGIVLAALLGLAVMHALLIGGQIRLDAMRRDVAAESEEIRRLELRVAQLESPQRVLDAARSRLGMVQPDEVGYLVAGTGDGADPLRVPPATVPPEPEPVLDVVTDAGPEAGPEAGPDGADSAGETTAEAEVPEIVHADDRPSEGGRDE